MEAYSLMQTIYGYQAEERLGVTDWWDTLLLELDCTAADEFDEEFAAEARVDCAVWTPIAWEQGSFAEWQTTANGPLTDRDASFARVMLRLHRTDTSGTGEAAKDAWASLQHHLLSLIWG